MLEELCRRALASEGETPTLAGVIRRLRSHQDGLGRLGVKQIYVYGSVARGEARPWSDVDLFAELADEQRWNIVRWGHVLERLQEILARRVDFAARRSLPQNCSGAPTRKRSRCSREAGKRSRHRYRGSWLPGPRSDR